MPPRPSAPYSEQHPYGPGAAAGEFNPDLRIAVAADQRAGCETAMAACDGMVAVFPSADRATCTVVLQPAPAALQDINSALGQPALGTSQAGNLAFVYRNLDLQSVQASMQRLLPIPYAPNELMKSNAALPVQAGTALGNVAGAAPWIGFEIVFLPGGLFPVDDRLGHGLSFVGDWIDPQKQARRLDPATFFAAIAAGGPLARVALAPEHVNHPILVIMTRRVLVEIRDEYDRPYAGAVTVQGTVPATTSSWGTYVLAGPGAAAASYTVGVAQCVLAPLPSGDPVTLWPSPASATLAAPAHWALQAIYLNKDPTDPEVKGGGAATPRSWFVPNSTLGLDPTSPDLLPTYTGGNRVTFYRDGYPDGKTPHTGFFPQLAAEMARLLTDPNDRFLLCARDFDFNYAKATAADPDFALPLVPGTTDTLVDLWKQANAAGKLGRVCILIDGRLATDAGHVDINARENTSIAKVLRNDLGALGQVIRDSTLSGNDPAGGPRYTDHLNGAYHQKMAVIVGKAGAVAFCGGMDVEEARVDTARHPPNNGNWHDVQAKVEGNAVQDLHDTFAARWNNHAWVTSGGKSYSDTDGGDGPVDADGKIVAYPALPPTTIHSLPGKAYVQVARTYAPFAQLPFAKTGSLTIRDALVRSIQRAQKYVYIEDQYMVPYAGPDPDTSAVSDDLGILDALLDALDRVDYLLFLMAEQVDQPQSHARRRRFLHALIKKAPAKVFAFTLRRPENASPIFVHSKVWIVDDVIAKIGSSNVCRRSYTNDGEADLFIVDGTVENGARAFARQLRTELWAEHLNLGGARVMLEDHRRALQLWLKPPKGARVWPYMSMPGGPVLASYLGDLKTGDKDPADTTSVILQRPGWEDVDPDGRK
jgi:phosphatidylserine/phosphatidylglycerophosphate/cardiolipin synthase-like enzyme